MRIWPDRVEDAVGVRARRCGLPCDRCRRNVERMASRSQPTGADRVLAMRIVLSGAACGDDLVDVADRLASLHPRNNTFPGEVLLGLAADAIELSGASRDAPIEFEHIRERYLPEAVAHTKAQHEHSKYALRAAAMLRGGVDPGLLDEISWWRSDDQWYWSLEALFAYLRAAADRTGDPIEAICQQLADMHHVTLDNAE
jgi:hypothetical protein